MRHALVIARRELAEKRFVAFAAAGFAVLPYLLAAIPVVRGRAGAADIIATGAGLLAVGFTLGLALVLGASIVGRDLSEGRLSFYFARPLGAPALWFGKVAAALALIAGTFLIIVVPARLTAASGWTHSWGKNAPALAAAVIGASFVLFFAAHVVGSFVRSRSAWVGLDFAALSLAALAGYLIVRELLDVGAVKALALACALIGAGVAVALVGGGAWQLSRGRTDRQRSHLALSQFVWMSVAAGLVLAAGFIAWLAAAKPSDLTTILAEPQGNGPWLAIAGHARGRLDYMPGFVFNSQTGAYTRLPMHGMQGQLMFTRDGRTLLVGRFDRRSKTIEIFKRALDDGEEVSTGLTLSVYGDLTPNDDGSRIVTADRASAGMLNVYDVAQRRSLVSARLPENAGDVAGMHFVTPSLVRVYTISKDEPEKTLRAFELDANARALRPTGELAPHARYFGLLGSPDGARLLARTPDALHLLDGRTLAVQATLPGRPSGMTFLRDGGFAVLRDQSIEVHDAAGALARTIRVPVPNTWTLRETSDGSFVTLGRSMNWPHTYVIDAKSGAVLQHIPAEPAGWRSDLGWMGHDLRRPTPARPSLFLDHQRLLRWNYATKQAEVLLP